jgi:hypothetical protein
LKAFKIFVFIFLSGWLLSCSGNNSATTPSSAMSASVNGSGSINFSASFNNSNGMIIMTGSGNTYTVQLFMRLSTTGGTYTLGDPSGSYYATVSDNFGNKYSTNASSIGQAVVTQSGSSGLYNGTFYFSAVETSPTVGGNTITVSNGQFSNM